MQGVNAAILRKLTRPWQVQYQADDEASSIESDELKLLLVAPSGSICQRLTLPKVMAQSLWAENEPVSNLVTEYVVRGAARLAPASPAILSEQLSPIGSSTVFSNCII